MAFLKIYNYEYNQIFHHFLNGIFLLINNLKAQSDTTKWLDNNQIKFSLTTAVIENIGIDYYNLNCQLLRSYPMPGVEATASYYLHLNKGWDLISVSVVA